MGGQLSVIFSDSYMVKLKYNISVLLNLKFYRRYVDDMFSRRKVNTNNILFEWLNNKHLKSKSLSNWIQTNSWVQSKFVLMGSITLWFLESQKYYQSLGLLKYINVSRPTLNS